MARPAGRTGYSDRQAAPAGELSDSIAALAGLPITFKLGGHDLADFVSADLIVVNPAVDRAKSPEIQAALAKKIPTTTEMNLFLERCMGRTIGITGSVGKSTTTALINEALTAGLGQSNLKAPKIFLGGNIGKSLLADLTDIKPNDYVVLELSSFMLEETPAVRWSPHIAVVTNVVPITSIGMARWPTIRPRSRTFCDFRSLMTSRY